MLPGYKLFGVIDLYYSFHALAFIALFLLLLWLAPKYGIKRLKVALAAVLIYVSAYAWMLILYWVESGFKTFGGQNIVRIFVWLPVFTFLYSKLLKINWQSMCDLVAPCLTLNHGIAHIACVFQGCCYGYETNSAICVYNANFGKYLFPIQLLEAFVALAITAFLLYRMKKQKFQTTGDIYPIMLILFGSTRFVLEFFRDNDKVLFGISNLALHALLAFIVGAAWYATLKEINRRKNKKQRRPS